MPRYSRYYGPDAEDSELSGTVPFPEIEPEQRDYRALRISVVVIMALGLIVLGGCVWAAVKFL